MGAFTTRRQQHRNRGSLMNWRVLTVVAAGLVLALATYSNSWQRQHFGGDPMLRDPMLRTSAAGRGGSGRRSRERTTIERAYGNGDGEHALDAAEGVQQLTSTIDRKRGTAGVLQEGAEGEAARGGAVEAPAKPVPKEVGLPVAVLVGRGKQGCSVPRGFNGEVCTQLRGQPRSLLLGCSVPKCGAARTQPHDPPCLRCALCRCLPTAGSLLPRPALDPACPGPIL